MKISELPINDIRLKNWLENPREVPRQCWLDLQKSHPILFKLFLKLLENIQTTHKDYLIQCVFIPAFAVLNLPDTKLLEKLVHEFCQQQDPSMLKATVNEIRSSLRTSLTTYAIMIRSYNEKMYCSRDLRSVLLDKLCIALALICEASRKQLN